MKTFKEITGFKFDLQRFASAEQEALFKLLNPPTGFFRTGESITAGAHLYTNATVPIIIQYTGSEVGAWISIDASGDFLFNIGATEGAATVDTNVGSSTDGVIDTAVALYNNFGKLVDYINDLDDYSAVLKDAYRTQTTDIALLAVASGSTTNAKVVGGIGFVANNGAVNGIMTVGITRRSSIDLTADENGTNIIHQMIYHPIYASDSVNIVVREINDANDTEMIVFQKRGSTTDIVGSQSFAASGLAAARGNRLVVSLDNSSSAAPTSTSKLTVVAQRIRQS